MYYYSDKRKRDGTWERIHNTLFRETRIHEGHEAEPSAGITDTQSVKTTERGGESGYDGGKNINGRKRRILTDVPGPIITVAVHSAGIQDRAGAQILFPGIYDRFSRLILISADGAYTGRLIGWVKQKFGLIMEIVSRPKGIRGFTLLPRRRVVGRTSAWLNRHRRLSRDYGYLTDTGEVMIRIAMIGLMLHRPAYEE